MTREQLKDQLLESQRALIVLLAKDKSVISEQWDEMDIQTIESKIKCIMRELQCIMRELQG